MRYSPAATYQSRYADGLIAGVQTEARPVVLIPALEPGAALIGLVREISAARVAAAMVVVDDGSGSRYRHVFKQLERIPGVEVLRHERNLGKGAALKTGLRHIATNYPSSAGVVTADADGQHEAADIVHVASQLTPGSREVVIGARAMDQSAPLRSRFGNGVTRWILRWIAGQKLSDTQTGLRGIPMEFVPELLNIRSSRYDFELDMLMRVRQAGLRIREVPIRTVYIQENRGSHFRPVRDSMRVYTVFLRFCGLSLVTAALDNVLFVMALQYWPWIGLCQAFSRFTAGTFQFTMGRRRVFSSKAPFKEAFAKYWVTVAVTGAISYLMIQILVNSPLFKDVFTPVSAKITAETLLFFGNFAMQRRFVYASRRAVAAEQR